MQRLLSLFRGCEDLTDGFEHDGAFLKGPGAIADLKVSEDVSTDTTQGIASGKTTFSRLAWADFFRNVRIFSEISSTEPSVVLEVGCGNSCPLGNMIVNSGLATHYVGMDVVRGRAEHVAKLDGDRHAVGVWASAREGIPMVDGKVGYVLCLEAMEHFCETVAEMTDFFGEVNRVLAPGGKFILATPNPDGGPILHPNCHAHEFEHDDVIDTAIKHFNVTGSHVYRAKSGVASKLIRRNRTQFVGLPDEAIAALVLPSATVGKVIAGNVMYEMEKKSWE